MSEPLVRMVTTIERAHVQYEVFLGGERKYISTVYFDRHRASHRAGGQAFIDAARYQEKFARSLTEEQCS